MATAATAVKLNRGFSNNSDAGVEMHSPSPPLRCTEQVYLLKRRL